MNRKPLDDATVQKIRDLRADGHSWPAIAEACGISYYSARCAGEPGYREEHEKYKKGFYGHKPSDRSMHFTKEKPHDRTPPPVTLPRLKFLEKPFPPEGW